MCLLIFLNEQILVVFCQIYDTPDSELNLNDIFEFVGILTDPVLHEDNEDSELSNSELSNELCAEFMHPKVCIVI